ncbi:MAG TPA: hypothetical protein VFV67_28990 [Actinophytocola sp.]|nr:hypothetical protein [Actinophytocola sp.]HEU5474703.1 hypothetical protein [Actinophytocola sp.]
MHQPFHPLASHPPALPKQGGVHPRRSVGAAAALVKGADLGEQLLVLAAAPAGWAAWATQP